MFIFDWLQVSQVPSTRYSIHYHHCYFLECLNSFRNGSCSIHILGFHVACHGVQYSQHVLRQETKWGENASWIPVTWIRFEESQRVMLLRLDEALDCCTWLTGTSVYTRAIFRFRKQYYSSTVAQLTRYAVQYIKGTLSSTPSYVGIGSYLTLP